MGIRTADMSVGLGTDSHTRTDLVSLALLAEELGFRGLWLTEALGRDAFGVLTEIALRTEQIEVGTGIVNVFGRSAATLAQSAAGLSEALRGRSLNLGVGTSGRALVEGFHSTPFDRPVGRLRDYVRALGDALDGGPVGSGFRLAARPAGPVRVLVAGLTPASRRVAAEAGGWLPLWLDDHELAAGQVPDARVAAYYYTAVTTPEDPDVAAACDEVRRSAAWYLAANGTAYANLFRRNGFGAEVDTVIASWKAQDRGGARAAVTDEILHRTALAGTPEEILNRVATRRGRGVDEPVLRFADGLPAARVAAMLRALATAAEA